MKGPIPIPNLAHLSTAELLQRLRDDGEAQYEARMHLDDDGISRRTEDIWGITAALKTRYPEGRAELLAMMSDPNVYVKTNAARICMNFAPELALPVAKAVLAEYFEDLAMDADAIITGYERGEYSEQW
jgi:hypothetical protein